MFIFYIPLILLISFLFVRLTHPLSMGLTLFTQTIIICASSGFYSHSFWFSYILFLIFLGGLLVLFIYVSSLASNEIFTPSIYPMIFSMFIMIMALILFFFIDPMIINSNFKMVPSSIMSSYKLNMVPSLISTIYNSSSMFFTLFLIIYLLLTLFVVVKIINIYSSPLRSNN
uniref:NADH-ubiquinone oxidoreductase chain 6 n=1 Tax=Pacifastacus leniusculus TaxID=6720 RepID=A0A1L6V0H3_PACLE|nr:NADH dehydrogenase subunit 6 [Pacifastacus leniusculus]APS87294.1 NADH dehydrogenase subunit 6 [Pacifastacus leniusculus]